MTVFVNAIDLIVLGIIAFFAALWAGLYAFFAIKRRIREALSLHKGEPE